MAKTPVKDEPAKETKSAYDTQYDYVLDWIREANDARRGQNAYVQRAIFAYQGIPYRNSYLDNIRELTKKVFKDDRMRREAYDYAVKALEGKKNFTIHNGVETLVSMAMGGVGQYEFGPYDPDAKADEELFDRLASAAKHFYDTEKMDSLMPQWIRASVTSGVTHLHLKHEQKSKTKKATLLTSDQMLTDPKRFKTNRSRFIGFTQRESFRAVKNRVVKTKSGYRVKTINQAQVYVQDIVNQLNGNDLAPESGNSALHDTLRKDIDIFYQPLLTSITANRKGQADMPANPDYMYDGDEIEIAYVYDHMNDMYFEVINRKYVIVARQSDLKRNIKVEYLDSKGQKQTKTKEVKLDDPFVELPNIITHWDTYAITPIFYILDDFDALCAAETLLDHTLSIMAPITFQGQSSDAEKMARLASVSGEVVEGVAATFGVMNKAHDITPIITQIQRTEEKIKRVMKAVDPFELQAMIGDRASAKEVASASGQVAQGINPFISNIETSAAELGNKFIKLEIIFGDGESYSFEHNGQYDELTHQEMSATCEIRAKLVTSIKLEQAQNSRAALELIGALGSNEAIDKKEFLGTLIPIALNSLVNRETAKRMVLPAYRPIPEEILAEIKRKAELEAKKSDVDKIDLANYDDAQLDEMLRNLAVGGSVAPVASDLPTAPIEDPMAAAPASVIVDPLAPSAQGPAAPGIPLNPETGGMYANDPVDPNNQGVVL